MKLSRLYLGFALLAAMFFMGAAALAQEEDWPREIQSGDATILVYQPQPESLEGDMIAARAAVSVKRGGAEAVYGTAWFQSRVETDREARTATLYDVNVTKSAFPTAAGDAINQYADVVEREMSRWNLVLPIDSLVTAMTPDEAGPAGTAIGINLEPPRIMFVSHPAVLVTIDGRPELRSVTGTLLMRVVNSPYLVVFDPWTRSYYLFGGGVWYRADAVMGPWRATVNVPREAAELATGPQPAGAFPAATHWAPSPEIIVSTEPAELITTDGRPTYSPADPDGYLLYISNTSSDVFLDIGSQRYFVLLSGRWFSGPSLDGPWRYCAGNSLPAAFARIPQDSPMARVLASVPGTPQAEEAVADAQIPQTARVRRQDATLTVDYDGEPAFRPVEGTQIEYAINTSYAVMRFERRYYSCHRAVWYTAPAPIGPWVCADSVPMVIYTIPPTCPIYRVRFVYIYRVTPDVIYCGYTPGYEGCYVYGGTVVYGTGYHYAPYVGRSYCYARPATWGFRARYDWSEGNWGFSLGIGLNFFDFNARRDHGWDGWWGSGGFRARDYDDRRRVYVNRNTYITHNVFVSPERVRRVIYDRPDGDGRGAHIVRTHEMRVPQVARGEHNDVFADRGGNVYRRSDRGWSRLDRSGWSAPEKLAPAAERERTSDQPRERERVVPGVDARERVRESDRRRDTTPTERTTTPTVEDKGRDTTTREGRVRVSAPEDRHGTTPTPDARVREAEPRKEVTPVERTPAPAIEDKGRDTTTREGRVRVSAPEDRHGTTPTPDARVRTTTSGERPRATITVREDNRKTIVERAKPNDTPTQQLERVYDARERAKKRIETYKERTTPQAPQTPATDKGTTRDTTRDSKDSTPRQIPADTRGSKRDDNADDGKKSGEKESR